MYNSSNKADRIKCLKNGSGIQYLLNEAHDIFENPILIHDMEYKAIDYNKDITTDDPIWNEYASKGTIDSKWLNFFKDECFLEEAANTKKITFLTSDKLKYNRIYGKIFNKNNIQIGCVVMTACNRPFEDDDPMLFEALCDIFTAEFSKDNYYNDYGQAYFEKLLGELIAGIDDIALYAAHVESIYMHLESNLYFAVVDIGKCDPTYAQLAYYRDLFKETQPEYTYAIYTNYIVIIIDTDATILNVEKDLNQLNRLFHENNICAGISRSFENLFELDKYYKEALDVLNTGLDSTSQHILMYEQLKYYEED